MALSERANVHLLDCAAVCPKRAGPIPQVTGRSGFAKNGSKLKEYKRSTEKAHLY